MLRYESALVVIGCIVSLLVKVLLYCTFFIMTFIADYFPCKVGMIAIVHEVVASIAVTLKEEGCFHGVRLHFRKHFVKIKQEIFGIEFVHSLVVYE